MKHKEIKQDDIVLFKRHCNILNRETYQDGNVIFIDDERKLVSICWLEGYKSRNDDVPYEKVIAKYDPNGKYMEFENYSGTSILLEL